MPAVNIGMPASEQGLYWDPNALDGKGARIATHSMIKTFRRCPKQAEFKYVHRLKPKMLGTPLKRGKWIHALLEDLGNGRDWRDTHARYSAEFAKLFDEEKDFYGDMPTEISRMMEAYLWHYKRDPWKYVSNEGQLEALLPDGTLYRGKYDALIENQFGLWLVDHKSHKSLPNHAFRLLDAQSALYLWAAQENGLEVQGFIWNYLRWKPPGVPKLLQSGKRISDAANETDYPTFVRALKKYKEENPQFEIRPQDRAKAKVLQGEQYDFDKPQTSPFFRRVVLEKSQEMLERVVQGNYTTVLRMNEYDFSNPDYVERVVERGCEFSCSYTDICSAELVTGDAKLLMRQNYVVGDPNSYYNDREGDSEKEDK